MLHLLFPYKMPSQVALTDEVSVQSFFSDGLECCDLSIRKLSHADQLFIHSTASSITLLSLGRATDLLLQRPNSFFLSTPTDVHHLQTV
jgi:hypothetical protein